MASRFLVLLLPALAVASIHVELNGEFNGETNSNLIVKFDGSDVGVITDAERNTFGLSDAKLKQSVAAYFGKAPNDAYLRSPTPWGDLFSSYGWHQVLTTLEPKSARIIGITSQPLIVLKQTFDNNSTAAANFNVGINQDVQNTVSSSWSKDGSLNIGQSINYGFNIEVAKLGGSTSFSYTSSWGENYQKTKTVSIGSTAAMEILLQPRQSVIAQLEASKGSIQIEVEYEASLNGAVAVNYDDGYKNHHFWALDVNAVMEAGGLKTKVMSKEVVNIEFYSNSRIVVYDRKMNTKLMNVPV